MFPKCEDPQFYVKGGGGAFADRQKSIFDQLDAAEKEQLAARNPINNDPPARDNDMEVEPFNAAVRTSRRNRQEMRQFRGKESIFKRPDAMPPRFKAKSTPDYHKNPHKWVKYSLGDVSQADMSNHSNTAAAFSFLQEIAARKSSAAVDEAEADLDSSTPITFRRPRSRPQLTLASVVVETESSQAAVGKPSFKSSKLMMPEYVVGMSKRKQRKREVQSMASTVVDFTGDNIPFSFPAVEPQQTNLQTSDDGKQSGDGEKQVVQLMATTSAGVNIAGDNNPSSFTVVEPQQTTSQISTKPTGDGEKQVPPRTKSSRRQRKKELLCKTTNSIKEIPLNPSLLDYVWKKEQRGKTTNSVKEIPLGHLMEYID